MGQMLLYEMSNNYGPHIRVVQLVVIPGNMMLCVVAIKIVLLLFSRKILMDYGWDDQNAEVHIAFTRIKMINCAECIQVTILFF